MPQTMAPCINPLALLGGCDAGDVLLVQHSGADILACLQESGCDGGDALLAQLLWLVIF